MGHIDQNLKADIASKLRAEDGDELAAHSAAVKRRRSKSKLYLTCSYIFSGVATTRGFYLGAQESGVTDFDAMLFATMQAAVAAALMAGACAILLDLSSELGESV